jgi:hypothetical protein
VITVDEEFLVEGRLEKPSAFYVLRRSSTDYDLGPSRCSLHTFGA